MGHSGPCFYCPYEKGALMRLSESTRIELLQAAEHLASIAIRATGALNALHRVSATKELPPGAREAVNASLLVLESLGNSLQRADANGLREKFGFLE